MFDLLRYRIARRAGLGSGLASNVLLLVVVGDELVLVLVLVVVGTRECPRCE
jgi:hypothetical protein